MRRCGVRGIWPAKRLQNGCQSIAVLPVGYPVWRESGRPESSAGRTLGDDYLLTPIRCGTSGPSRSRPISGIRCQKRPTDWPYGAVCRICSTPMIRSATGVAAAPRPPAKNLPRFARPGSRIAGGNWRQNGTLPASDEPRGASSMVTSMPTSRSFQTTPFSDQAPEGGNRLFT